MYGWKNSNPINKNTFYLLNWFKNKLGEYFY